MKENGPLQSQLPSGTTPTTSANQQMAEQAEQQATVMKGMNSNQQDSCGK